MGDPAFSPDGRYIAYTYASGTDVSDDNEDALAIGLFDTQTNTHAAEPIGVLPLPNNATDDAAAFCEDPYGPTWSPNGTKVAIENYYGLATFTLSNPNVPSYMPFPSGGFTDPSWAPFGGKFAVGSVPNDVGTIPTTGTTYSKLTWSGLAGDTV
jgi:Tol biopolymer transport system component